MQRPWIGKFTGILEQDSPSAVSLIIKHFGRPALPLISEKYKGCFKNDSLLEPHLCRKPEIRFNPKPARIIYIILEEAKWSDLKNLILALEKCTETQKLSLDHLANLSSDNFKNDPHLSVFLLDELRHLHMHSSLNQKQLATQLEKLGHIFEQSDKFLPNRLALLIAKALERAKNLRLNPKKC